MHPIFEIGKHESKTPYQMAYENARKHAEPDIDDTTVESHEKRRISRRKTVSKQLIEGRGLSDSHGGKWIKGDEMSDDEKRRTGRRLDLSKRLTNSR
jgi:hypothetical protein